MVGNRLSILDCLQSSSVMLLFSFSMPSQTNSTNLGNGGMLDYTFLNAERKGGSISRGT